MKIKNALLNFIYSTAILGHTATAYSSTIDIPENSKTKKTISLAKETESKIIGTVWNIHCDEKDSKFRIGLDSGGRVVLNEGYKDYSWRLIGSSNIHFTSPNGEGVNFILSPDRKSLQFISFEGWRCRGEKQ